MDLMREKKNRGRTPLDFILDAHLLLHKVQSHYHVVLQNHLNCFGKIGERKTDFVSVISLPADALNRQEEPSYIIK